MALCVTNKHFYIDFSPVNCLTRCQLLLDLSVILDVADIIHNKEKDGFARRMLGIRLNVHIHFFDSFLPRSKTSNPLEFH